MPKEDEKYDVDAIYIDGEENNEDNNTEAIDRVMKIKREKLLEKYPTILPSTTSAIMLFIAPAPLPYGYYTWLRLVVVGCSIFNIYFSITYKKILPTIIFLFDPCYNWTQIKEGNLL